MQRLPSTAFSLVRGVAVRSLSTKAAAEPSKKDIDTLFDKEKPQERKRFGASVNRVELLGGVAETPALRTARNGRNYTLFAIITNNLIRHPDGETTQLSERHTVCAFGKTAEYVQRNVQRGTRVLVHGHLHYSGNQLQEDGTRTPRQTHIYADLVQPIAKTQPFGDAKHDDDEF